MFHLPTVTLLQVSQTSFFFFLSVVNQSSVISVITGMEGSGPCAVCVYSLVPDTYLGEMVCGVKTCMLELG